MATLDAEFGGGGGGRKEEVTEGRKGEERAGGREGAKEEEGEKGCACLCVCKQDVKFNLQEKGSEERDK